MTVDSSTADSTAVRTIDTGALPERYARGWHCLGLAEGFRAVTYGTISSTFLVMVTE